MEAFQSNHLLASSLLFLCLTSFLNTAAAAEPAANTEFIKNSCMSTTYPILCYSSLSSHASAIGVDRKLLAHAALTVSLDTARTTSIMMVRLAQRQGLSHRETGAMRDCVEELSDSVDQLRKSLAEMNQLRGSSDFAMMMSDIQTWVSAALTDEDTCTDGFAGNFMNGNLKTTVRGQILNVAHITSNALALINAYANFHG